MGQIKSRGRPDRNTLSVIEPKRGKLLYSMTDGMSEIEMGPDPLFSRIQLTDSSLDIRGGIDHLSQSWQIPTHNTLDVGLKPPVEALVLNKTVFDHLSHSTGKLKGIKRLKTADIYIDQGRHLKGSYHILIGSKINPRFASDRGIDLSQKTGRDLYVVNPPHISRGDKTGQISDDSSPDPADPAAAHEVAWAGDLMRGLAGGRPWILMEQAPSAVQWRRRNSPKRPGQLLLWSLARVAHGADGVLQFQWRQSRQGAETFHSGMVPHAGRDSRTWEETVATGQALRRLGPVLGEPVRAEAALVVDWESQWALSTTIGPVEVGERFEAARAWHRSLWETGIATDIVPVGRSLEGYRLIIVPAVFIDRPELAEHLEQAIAAGAQVVVAGPTGVVDANAGAVLGGYLGSLRPLLGVRVTDHAALTGQVQQLDPRGALVNRLSRAVGTPAAETWTGLEAVSEPLRRVLDRMGTPAPDLRAGGWAEELRIDEAPEAADENTRAGQGWQAVEVVAVLDGRGGGADLAGRPAITRRSMSGAGAGWYVAADLDALSRAALLTLVCAHARVRPVVADLPDGVEAQRRGKVLFLLNHGDRAAEVVGVMGTDLLTGDACTGHVVLSPRSALVVRTRT